MELQADQIPIDEGGPPPSRRWLPRRQTLGRIWRSSRPWIGPLLVAGLYAWFALHHLPGHRYQINPDGVGYISVARKYLGGHFADAVNAYWSPLYSWLLVPLLALGIEKLLAAKILGLLIGGATLAGLWRLMRVAAVQADVRTIACVAAIPLVVYAVYGVTTSDLLVACALIFYLASLANPANSGHWARGAWIGVAGGMAYLAKAYALPFVLGHFAIVRSIELIRPAPGERRSRLIMASLSTLAAMALIVGAWSAALTHKYGHFMTGSTGKYNLRIDAPGSPGQVMHWAGLLPPSDPHAVSVWDDITPHIDLLPAWDPLATPEDRQYLRTQVIRNYDRTIAILHRHTAWVYPLLLAAGLIAMSRADLRPRRPGLILAAAILVYPLGYFILHIEERFLTPLILLLLIAGMYAIGRAARKGLLNSWWRRSIAAAALGATFLSHPIDSLERAQGTGVNYVEAARQFDGILPVGARVASDRNWSSLLYLSFYQDWQYYGEPARRQPREQILADLESMGVEYFFSPRPATWLTHAGWTPVAPETQKPFHIYRSPALPDNDARR